MNPFHKWSDINFLVNRIEKVIIAMRTGRAGDHHGPSLHPPHRCRYPPGLPRDEYCDGDL